MSVNIMALLEGLSLGVAGGVDPGVLRQIIKDGLANSTVLQVWGDMGPRWKGMMIRISELARYNLALRNPTRS